MPQNISSKSTDFNNPKLDIKPSIEVSIGSNDLKIQGSMSLEYIIESEFGSFKPAIQAAITVYSNYLDLNKKGVETRISKKLSYENDFFEIGLATNYWNGFLDMNEFKQQTAIANFKFKNLINPGTNINIFYENDGFPYSKIGVTLPHDRYRTAAARIMLEDLATQSKYSLNLILFTGYRKSQYEKKSDLKETYDGLGNYYPFGYVFEEGTPYRYSLLSFLCSHKINDSEYLEYTIGVNYENIRHFFQDIFAHSILSPIKQGGFKIYDNKPKFNVEILYILGNDELYSLY